MKLERLMRCPVCEGEDFRPGQELFDDRYGYPGSFDVKSCVACGHLKTFPPLQESDLGNLYSRYYPRRTAEARKIRAEVADTGGRDKALRRWWMGVDNQGQYQVSPGESYLDIGCGNGNSLLEAELAGARAAGIEADPNVGPLADALGLRITIGSIFDGPFPGESFDLISLNQVIEHMPEPEAALEAIRARLGNGGRLFVACPNRASLMARLFGKRWINWHIPYHQNHFDRQGLERMARRCGYKVRQMRTVTPNVWLLMQIRAMRESPEIGKPSRIWSSGWSGGAMAPGSPPRLQHTFKRLLRGAGLSGIAVIARLVDAVGRGESLVAVLEVDEAR